MLIIVLVAELYLIQQKGTDLLLNSARATEKTNIHKRVKYDILLPFQPLINDVLWCFIVPGCQILEFALCWLIFAGCHYLMAA